MLEGHDDLGLIVGLGPREDRDSPHEGLLQLGEVGHVSTEHLVERPPSDTELAVPLVRLVEHLLHEGLGLALYRLSRSVQLLPCRAIHVEVDLQSLLGREAIVHDHVGPPDGRKLLVLRANISGGVIVLLEIEPLLGELPIDVVANDHALAPVGDVALVADVRPSQRVVPRDHHATDLRRLQRSNSPPRLMLQLVLKYLKTVKNQIFFSLLPSQGLN